MKTVRLYIDGVEADVTPGTFIAMTYQFYSPLNPDVVRLSFSNQFVLPPTNTNLTLLGRATSLKSTSQVNKVRIPCRLVQSGIEVIPNGYIVLQQVERTRLSCVIYSVEGDLYNTLKDRTLNDLDYTDINQALEPLDLYALKDEAEVAGGSGEVFVAVINLGQNIVDNAGTPQYTDNYVLVTPPYDDIFVPVCFGYKQILQRIIAQAGFNYDFGDLVSGSYPNPKFNSLAVHQAGYEGEYRFQYSSKFREEVEFAAITDADESFVDIGSGSTRVLQFLSTIKPSDFYEPDPTGPARSRYVVTNADTALGYFTGTFRFTGTVNKGAAGSADIAIYVNGVKQTGAAAQTLAAGDNKVDIYVDQNTLYLGLKDGDIVEIRVHQTAANPCTVTYYIGCRFEFTCFGAGLQYVYLNQLLPSINQLDYYKDFLFRFGQIPNEANKTVTYKSLKDILDDVEGAVDWTEKRYKKDWSHRQHLDLAQRNYFQYELLDQALGEKYGSGYYDLDDETLPAEAVYTSIWGSTLDTTEQGINCATIADAQQTLDASGFPIFQVDIGNRLLLTRQKYTKEPSLWMDPTLMSGPETDYTIGCFTKQDSVSYERSLAYQKVLEEWYTTDGSMDTGFLERLKNAKVVTRYYWLTAMDVKQLNPHKLIIDDSEQFLFPVIRDHVAGKLTEVEMLKI